MHLWFICLAPFVRTQIESLVHTMKIWWRAFEFSVWKWLKVITWPISIQFKITSNQSEFKVKMHYNFKLPVNANDQSQSYHSSAKSTPALAYPFNWTSPKLFSPANWNVLVSVRMRKNAAITLCSRDPDGRATVCLITETKLQRSRKGASCPFRLPRFHFQYES